MISIRRAVIDVGTNSVKLLVADVAGRSVTPVDEKSRQTRLGAGFYETHLLQRDSIERTAAAVAEFSAEAAARKTQSIRVIATSAARDALNQEDLRIAIQAASGLSMEVISGATEADWVFAGVTSDPALNAQPLLIVDIGGGSSEFILSDGASPIFRQSFQLGTVRLLEQLQPSDPPRLDDWKRCDDQVRGFLNEQVKPKLAAFPTMAPESASQLVATGGTASILAAMQLELVAFDRTRIESLRLTQAQVRQRQKHLWSISLAERRTLPGLPPNRADVILMGSAILAALMEEFGFSSLRVSTRGLRFAALMDPALP